MNKKELSKKLQELLSYGTPKQKALLVCQQWADKMAEGSTPLLTEDEVEALRKSLRGDYEVMEYNKWINVYNVYADITPLFGAVYKEYQAAAERVLGYLRQWEAYNQEENHLIIVYQALEDSGNEEGKKVFLETLPYLTLKDANLITAEDGFPEIDIDPLYKKIQAEIGDVYKLYESAKAMVTVIDGYAERTRSKKFRPEIMIEAIEAIKEDYSQRVAPRYSRKLLSEREEKGVFITPDERMRAIYPSYDEIEAPEEDIKFFKDRLDSIVRHYEGKKLL